MKQNIFSNIDVSKHLKQFLACFETFETFTDQYIYASYLYLSKQIICIIVLEANIIR